MSYEIQQDKIRQFETLLMRMPQVVLKTEHEFCNGVYARTMYIPEGVALTGAIHSEENFFVVRSGEVIVYTEQGMKHCKAGDMYVSYPGIKRIGYAVKDSVITTFHQNPENINDPEEIWERYTIDENAVLINNETMLIEYIQ